jgi:hypothetical protein
MQPPASGFIFSKVFFLCGNCPYSILKNEDLRQLLHFVLGKKMLAFVPNEQKKQKNGSAL